MFEVLSYLLFMIMFIIIAGAVTYFFVSYFKDVDRKDISKKIKKDKKIDDNKYIDKAETNIDNDIVLIIDKRDFTKNHRREYYVTCQFRNGDKKELMVNHNAYGLLTKGDIGKVTFNEKKLTSFTRIKKNKD